MEEYIIERRKGYGLDMFIRKENVDIIYIKVEGWFKEYLFYDVSTQKLRCSVRGGNKYFFIPILKIFLYDEEAELSITNRIFSATNECKYLNSTYKIVSKVLKETKIYENGFLILEMLNTKKNTIYNGSQKVYVREKTNLFFLFALLIGFCDDFSWHQ